MKTFILQRANIDYLANISQKINTTKASRPQAEAITPRIEAKSHTTKRNSFQSCDNKRTNKQTLVNPQPGKRKKKQSITEKALDEKDLASKSYGNKNKIDREKAPSTAKA